MKPSAVFLSAFYFVHSLLLIMLGMFFIGLDKVPHVKHALGHFLDAHPAIFSLLGLGSISSGIVLFVVMFNLYKKIFYQVKMNPSSVSIDPVLIKGYVERSLKHIAPNPPLLCEVVITKDQRIEIIAKLPGSSVLDHEKFLGMVKGEIAAVFK